MANDKKRKAFRHPVKESERAMRESVIFNGPIAVAREAGLSVKELHFCELFLRNGNDHVKAAKEAGYRPTMGKKLLKNHRIASYINEKLIDKFDMTSDNIRKEIGCVINANIKDVCVWDENSIKVIPSDQLSRETTAGIQEITFRQTEFMGKGGQPGKIVTEAKVKMHSKGPMLYLAAKMQGLLDQDGNTDLSELGDKVRGIVDQTTSGLYLPTLPDPATLVIEPMVQEEEETAVSDRVKH